jgi:hypothetical protein
MTEAGHSRNNARQLCDAAREFDQRGNPERAKQCRERALDMFVEAGLDPAWTDEEYVRTSQLTNPVLTYCTERSDGMVHLHHEFGPGVASGIVIHRDDFVSTEEWR